MPIDTIIGQNSVIVVPPLRGGVLVDFGLRPQRALTGILVLRRGAQETPLGGIDTMLASASSKIELFTAGDGAFYVEDAAPGSYQGEARVDGASCRIVFTIDENAKMPLNLGKVYCEALH